MSSGSHRTLRQRSTPPTAHQSQPADRKQLQQEIGNQTAAGIRRSPSTPPQHLHSILAASQTCSSLRDTDAPPVTHAHTRTHADTGTRCPDRQAHGCMLVYAHKRTHMLSFILTWLESWLPPGEERKSKEGRAIRVRLLPGGVSTGVLLRLAPGGRASQAWVKRVRSEGKSSELGHGFLVWIRDADSSTLPSVGPQYPERRICLSGFMVTHVRESATYMREEARDRTTCSRQRPRCLLARQQLGLNFV